MVRILFVDDDGLGLRLMTRLCSLLGYQAMVNLSAVKALEVACSERPDLILVDLRMAEMDGLEFVRQVRCTPETAQIPVLIYSAGTGDMDEQQALEAGANGFLMKPLGPDELDRVVETYVKSDSR